MRTLAALLAASLLAPPVLPASAGPGDSYADGSRGPAGKAFDRLLSRDSGEATALDSPDAGDADADPSAPQDCRLLVTETTIPA